MALFRAVLQRYEGEEIAEGLNDELKKVTSQFEVTIFVLLSYDLYNNFQDKSHVAQCAKNLCEPYPGSLPHSSKSLLSVLL